MSRRMISLSMRQAMPILLLAGLGACAQTQPPAPVATSAPPPPSPPAVVADTAAKPKAPDSLDFYFAPGSTKLRAEDVALLDKASRLYRDGNPIVMVVAGSSDTVGSPESNLKLSQARADAVLQGLVARGIPVGRFQVLAKGVTDLPVQTGEGVANQENRRVDLTWR